jgi:hypothetical protein
MISCRICQQRRFSDPDAVPAAFSIGRFGRFGRVLEMTKSAGEFSRDVDRLPGIVSCPALSAPAGDYSHTQITSAATHFNPLVSMNLSPVMRFGDVVD